MNNLIHIPETTSTNEFLNDYLRNNKLEEGTIVLADFQTAGKGQTGNVWESNAGLNLTFSVLLYPDTIEIQNQFILSQLISLAIVDTLTDLTENVSIKWPNDIYVGDKKIAGILIENVISGKCIESCIVGIGLNVNQEVFSSWIPNPTSLKILTNTNTDPITLLSKIRSTIFQRYMQVLNYEEDVIRNEYFKKLYRNMGYHKYTSMGTIFVAKILSVKHSGQLVVETENGETQTFGFKEIEFVQG